MYQIIILHDTEGSVFENWIPWLGKKLTANNFKVLAPQFPTPEGQNYKTWFHILDSYKDYFDRNNTIFITHSISASFAVKYLIQTQKHIKGFISVSGFSNVSKNDKSNNSNLLPSFLDNVEYNHFEKYAKKRYQILSENDENFSKEELEEFGDKIKAQNVIIPNGGRFNSATGYDKFEELYSLIEEVMKD